MATAAKTTRHHAGPTSRADRLARLDGRTREGKIIRGVEAALISDLGGEDSITAAERLLVRSAAIKSLRMELLAEQMHAGEHTEVDPHHLVSWTNSLRLDLCALGLKRRARDLGGTGPQGTGPRASIRDRALASGPFVEAHAA